MESVAATEPSENVTSQNVNEVSDHLICGSPKPDFKSVFRSFKALREPVWPDLQPLCGRSVTDPREPTSSLMSTISLTPNDRFQESDLSDVGLRPSVEWQVRELNDCPGAMIISNVFTVDGQRRWIQRCLTDFPPNQRFVSNMDPTWNFEESRADIDWLAMNEPDNAKRTRTGAEWRSRKDKGRLETMPLWKLRWITLGYHHDWDTKIYSDENKSPFPEDVALLCRVIARVLGFDEFSAEAAIINFYHLDSTLSPHQDISEPYKEAPLFSISFGQPAVFLIGSDKEQAPCSVILRSGDVFIMTGRSRLAFHAVPKVFKDEDNSGIFFDTSDPKIDLLNDYLRRSRINMNIRQVLRPGETKLYS